MAPAKKGTTKPAAKKTEVKAAEAAVKTTAPKTEEKAAAKAAVKAEEKKVEVPAAAAKAEEPEKKPGRKPAAKKPAAKKSTAKKADLKSSVCVQFAGKSYSQEDLVKMARDVWKYDLKQKLGDLVSVELYVKTEENTVYYVMNKDVTGNFNI